MVDSPPTCSRSMTIWILDMSDVGSGVEILEMSWLGPKYGVLPHLAQIHHPRTSADMGTRRTLRFSEW